MVRRTLAVTLGLILCTSLAPPVNALTLVFSGAASEDGVSLSDLSATVDLAIESTAGGSDRLSIRLHNQSAAYTLAEFFLNYAGTPSDLDAFAPQTDPLGTGELLVDTDPSQPKNLKADGFGSYHMQLDLVSTDNSGLGPAELDTWKVDLGGTGFNIADFQALSHIPPGHTPAVAALKFTQGEMPPDSDASVFVIPIAEPTSLLLLGSGLLGILALRRHERP